MSEEIAHVLWDSLLPGQKAAYAIAVTEAYCAGFAGEGQSFRRVLERLGIEADYCAMLDAGGMELTNLIYDNRRAVPAPPEE